MQARAGAISLVLLSLVLAAGASIARAQEPAPWLEMTIVQVDPARVGEFLAAQREISAPREGGGHAVAQRRPYRRVRRHLPVRHHHAARQLRPVSTGPDDDGARTGVVSRIRNVITSRATYAVRTAPTLDNPLPDGEAPALMIVQVVSVAPGREQEYLRVMAEDVLPHFDEAEMHHTTGALTFGGEGGYVHVFHVDNFAALDQGSPMARALGAPGALEVMAKLSGVVTRSEQWLVRYLHDVSFQPEAEAESQP